MTSTGPGTQELTRWNEPLWIFRSIRQARFQTDQRLGQAQGRSILESLHPTIEAPIFIIGSPRSGTSFLGRSLGEIPEAVYFHEPIATKAAARHIYDGTWTWERAERFHRRVYRWMLRGTLQGYRRLVDKTPRNAFVLPFLANAFPQARFLHLLRDGRDVTVSYAEKPWLTADSATSEDHEPGGYPYGPYPRFWVEEDRREEFRTTTDIHRCCWAWRRHVQAVLDAEPELGDQLETIRYEELTSDPHSVADRILDHVSIETAEARRRLHDAMEQASTSSVGRWKEALSEEERSTVEEEAGDLLERLGYTEG